MKCPKCGGEASKSIYAGFPVKICLNEECSVGWGFWSWVPTVYFNGWFFLYDGSYIAALWCWLFHDH